MCAIVRGPKDETFLPLLLQYDFEGRRARFDPRQLVRAVRELNLGFVLAAVKERFIMYLAVQAIWWPSESLQRIPRSQPLVWRTIFAINNAYYQACMPMPEIPGQHNPHSSPSS